MLFSTMPRYFCAMFPSPKIVLQKAGTAILYKHICNNCWDSYYMWHEPLTTTDILFCSSWCIDNSKIHEDEVSEINSWYQIIGASNIIAIPNEKMRKMIPPKLYHSVIDYYQWICQYCWVSCYDQWVTMTIDHIVPVTAWWKNEFKNLVIACHRCNNLLWDRLFDNFQDKYAFMQSKLKRNK